MKRETREAQPLLFDQLQHDWEQESYQEKATASTANSSWVTDPSE